MVFYTKRGENSIALERSKRKTVGRRCFNTQTIGCLARFEFKEPYRVDWFTPAELRRVWLKTKHEKELRNDECLFNLAMGRAKISCKQSPMAGKVWIGCPIYALWMSLVRLCCRTARGGCGLRDSHSKFFFPALNVGMCSSRDSGIMCDGTILLRCFCEGEGAGGVLRCVFV